MTGMAATRLGLRERGLVQPGYFADLTVFDAATVKDESTYAEPHRYPTGIPYVLVNGAVVVDDSRMGSARTGRILTPR
jgi:N-acyl-D-aspartate/D-glutamate deacylase